MNSRLCLQIAGRIDAALQATLGEGIDLGRMLAEPLYRRDVLLVCDAHPGSELALLARQFREASIAEEPEPAGSTDSGFSPSRFFNSLFGALGMPVDQPPPDMGADDEPRRRANPGRWRR
jgi:hypothetical protein